MAAISSATMSFRNFGASTVAAPGENPAHHFNLALGGKGQHQRVVLEPLLFLLPMPLPQFHLVGNLGGEA